MKLHNFTIMLLIFFLSACQISSIPPTPEQQSVSPSAQEPEINQTSATINPSPIIDQTDEPSIGPWLLIKDDTNPNQLLSMLDISTNKIEPISLPPGLTITNLSKSISPDNSTLVLTQIPSDSFTNQNLFIYDYLNGEIEAEIPITPFEPIDFPKIYGDLPVEIKKLMTNRNYGVWMLSDSTANSLNTFQWINNGTAVYYSKIGIDGFSNLFKYDLISKKNSKLESEPYFLEAVKPSPEKSSLLVIKSLLTQIPDFPIKSVFVITENNKMIQLPFPEKQAGFIIDFSWFDSENILITTFDSLEFSYTNLGYFHLPDQQFHEMTTSQFDKLVNLNEQVILLSTDDQNENSKLEIYTLDNLVQSLLINEKCTQATPSPLPRSQLIVTCEQNSYSLGDDFSINRLPGIQGNLYFSPNNQFIINNYRETSEGQQSILKLLNTDFTPIREFPVGSTRQVIWQPDSQGFLFLTMDGLYHVSLPNGQPKLVYESNADDYRYLDVFWINP